MSPTSLTQCDRCRSMERQHCRVMKVRTNYNYTAHDKEIIDSPRVTDGNQYVPISEIVQRTIRGENLDIHDYSGDNWIDKCDKFDVMDMYGYKVAEEEKAAKAAEEAAKAAKEAEEAAAAAAAAATPPPAA